MNWAMIVLLALLCLFAALLLWFERSKTDEKLIAVIGTLGALAAAARIPFAVIPNVQPTTFIVMLAGYVFGMRVGFFVGAIAAVLSNIYFGQGPWTLWQMFAWGLSGFTAGLLRHLLERNGTSQPLSTRTQKWLFTALCTFWGFLFGWIMNLWIFLGLGSFMNWKSFVAYYAASLSFDTAHAVGNFIFSSLFAVMFARIFARYHRKLTVSRLQLQEEAGC